MNLFAAMEMWKLFGWSDYKSYPKKDYLAKEFPLIFENGVSRFCLSETAFQTEERNGVEYRTKNVISERFWCVNRGREGQHQLCNSPPPSIGACSVFVIFEESEENQSGHTRKEDFGNEIARKRPYGRSPGWGFYEQKNEGKDSDNRKECRSDSEVNVCEILQDVSPPRFLIPPIHPQGESEKENVESEQKEREINCGTNRRDNEWNCDKLLNRNYSTCVRTLDLEIGQDDCDDAKCNDNPYFILVGGIH
nr:hypothetical protein [Ferrimicrobium acidiphilum]